MKKRMLTIALSICMLLTLLPTGAWAAGDEGLRVSGSLTMDKLSKREIVQLLEDDPITAETDIFVMEPSCTAPYATGKVKTSALQAATDRLNALRRIAGLPSVTLDLSLSENAQYGAVLLGKLGYLDHRPAKPGDMDESFYQKAYEATSSSNLHAHVYGRSSSGGITEELVRKAYEGVYQNFPLPRAVDDLMEDTDEQNITSVGHRRWQLNPAMGKVGFGYAVAEYREEVSGLYGLVSVSAYVAEKVFDKSGPGCDYDFIGWPSSGNFPSNTFGFDGGTAWSVTLNPEKFQTPNISSVTVTLTRESDGKSWTFSNGDSDKNGKYFNVDTNNYGVSNCIIFRPDGITSYDGLYTVRIDGLKAKSGQAVTDFTYQVDFFNTETYGTFSDVSKDAYYADPVFWAVENGVTDGTSDTTFSPNQTCTQAQILTFLYRAVGEPAVSGTNPYSNAKITSDQYYYNAMLWAAQKGIVTDGAIDPNAPCTRADVVTYLWRLAGSPAASGAAFTDVPSTADCAQAVAWAVKQGVTDGTSDTTFSPNNTCTRAQIVTFLYRDLA